MILAEGSPALFFIVIPAAFALCCALLWRTKRLLWIFPVCVGLSFLLASRISWMNMASDGLLFAAIGYLDYGVILWLKNRGALPRVRSPLHKASAAKEGKALFVARRASAEPAPPVSPGHPLALAALLLAGALVVSLAS